MRELRVLTDGHLWEMGNPGTDGTFPLAFLSFFIRIEGSVKSFV